MRAIKAFSKEAALLCAGAFALLLATSVSDFLRLDGDTGAATLGEMLGQLMFPAIPLGLALVLLAMRSQAAATMVATLGTIFYLACWVMLGM